MSRPGHLGLIDPLQTRATTKESSWLTLRPRWTRHRSAVSIPARSSRRAWGSSRTDAYDLFIIGTATTLIAKQWHLSSSQTGLVNSITLISAFAGAFFFGRVADRLGRKKIYGLEAALMVGGAVASAFAPDLIWLLVFRFVLGIGVGGDYPMSAVLMSEFSNRKNRGKLVGLVFSMQALGTVAGYIAGLTLLSAGVNGNLTWRLCSASEPSRLPR